MQLWGAQKGFLHMNVTGKTTNVRKTNTTHGGNNRARDRTQTHFLPYIIGFLFISSEGWPPSTFKLNFKNLDFLLGINKENRSYIRTFWSLGTGCLVSEPNVLVKNWLFRQSGSVLVYPNLESKVSWGNALEQKLIGPHGARNAEGVISPLYTLGQIKNAM